MDFELTAEQRLLQSSVKDFMVKECPRDYVRAISEQSEFPEDVYKKIANLGWTGLFIPEEFDGQGMGPLDFILFMEQLAYFFPVMTGPFVDTSLVCSYIVKNASEEQKKRFLPPAARGDVHYCFAMTEPDAGSDAVSLTTSAKKEGSNYILDGSKVFITGAHLADHILVVTRTDETVPKHLGISTFLSKRDSPGIELQEIPAMGTWAYYTNQIFLHGVRVPEENLIGGLNKGWDNLSTVLSFARIVIAACGVGLAQAAIDIALEYAKRRQQFGRPIGKFQAISHRLATMETMNSAARVLTYQAAWMYQRGVKCDKQASMVKFFACENCTKAIDQGLQVLGGYGYSREYDMQSFWRDTRFWTIGGGTSDIQLSIIAREMGL